MNASGQEGNLRSVLIVDDEDAFRVSLKHVLSLTGKYAVTVCDSGEQAISLLQHTHVDVVILDYLMPGISGLNVLQWMYEQKIETPVIMLTMAGTEAIAVETMKFGAYDYVRKENVDLSHIGILVDGVYERYLFRKEKEQREKMEQEREKSIVAIETFHSTLASIAQIVNNSLAMVSLRIQQHEMELRPSVPKEGEERLTKVFEEMRQEYSVVSSAVRSMLNMANVLHGNFTDTDYPAQIEEAFSDSLRTMQGRTNPHTQPKKP